MQMGNYMSLALARSKFLLHKAMKKNQVQQAEDKAIYCRKHSYNTWKIYIGKIILQ